jgi:hypothetical protein
MDSFPGQLTLDSNTLTPAERKRLRDRRAQRTLRERRDRLLHTLEAQVANCEKQHNPLRIQALCDQVQRLQGEIKEFQAWKQQLGDTRPAPAPIGTPELLPVEQHQHPVEDEPSLQSASFENTPSIHNPATPLTPASVAHQPITRIAQLVLDHPDRAASVNALDLLPALRDDDTCNTGLTSLSPLPDQVPACILIPSDGGLQSDLTLTTCPWFARPDLVAASPPTPSPLHLLYGSRSNYLANAIHESLHQHNLRDPETLAMGWLVYIYSKWRASPNPETFARLPVFMRPTLPQLQQFHLACVDQVVFPRMRLNLLKFCGCDIEKTVRIFQMLSCCLKVRWKWGQPIMEPDEQDNLKICESFYNTFMTPDGWGITPEFIDAYPETVEGMDVAQLLYSIV